MKLQSNLNSSFAGKFIFSPLIPIIQLVIHIQEYLGILLYKLPFTIENVFHVLLGFSDNDFITVPVPGAGISLAAQQHLLQFAKRDSFHFKSVDLPGRGDSTRRFAPAKAVSERRYFKSLIKSRSVRRFASICTAAGLHPRLLHWKS